MTFTDRQSLIRSFPRHGKVAEIGVFRGNFSSFIFTASSPAQLWLIDNWGWTISDRHPSMPNFNTEGLTGDEAYMEVIKKFHEAQNVAILRLMSHMASTLFEDEYLDWVYVDANHRYDDAKEDIDLWSKKVKPGGIVSGHDFHMPAVERAVRDHLRENPGPELQVTEERVSSWWFTK